nr:hypothetical protein [Tanacetum cinerariifolium]
KNTSYDHISAGSDLHVLTDQTKSVYEGLETVLTQPITKKGASSTAIHGDKEEASSTIKLGDLAKLVSQIQPSFKDLDSPKDDTVIIIDESDEVEPNAKTEDTSVPRSSSPRRYSNSTSALNDSIPQEQGMDEGTKNTSYDHISAGSDLHVLTDQTKSVYEGLETVLTQPITKKGASSTAIHGDKEEASSTIKLGDLAKLVSQIQPSFKDLDSPKDDTVIIIDESDEVEPNAKTEDTSVPRSSSPRSSQIQELTNQVLILKSQKHKLKLEKNKAEAEDTLLKAQPSFPNIE